MQTPCRKGLTDCREVDFRRQRCLLCSRPHDRRACCAEYSDRHTQTRADGSPRNVRSHLHTPTYQHVISFSH